ncbi:MAG: SpoIIE family protein phosphatase [Planctomycetes bacterium]|nr:SpoIIE family protein phosphatase [Planctomycetota bacterium]
MAFLKVTKGTSAGQLVTLHPERTVLGRHPTSQVVLDDGAVSRHHAEILEEAGRFYVVDLRSRNGTEVNGVKINNRTELREGDSIRVCDHAFQFLTDLDRELPERKNLDVPASDVRPGAATVDESDDSSRPTGPDGSSTPNPAGEGSSVISALEASSTGRGLRLNVRPEVKLRAVLEISSALGRVLDLQDVLTVILESLFKIFNQADAGFVLLKDADSSKLRVQASHCSRPTDDEVPISMTVVRQAMEQTQAILSADVMGDGRFRSSESLTDLRLRSLMCAPLLATDGSAIGVIQLSTLEVSHPFTSDDLDLLVSVSAQAAMAVENATLHDTIVRRRDMERDMSFAAQVQQGFLPSVPPQADGFEFADYYKSAYHVGGDYFDYVRLPDGRIAIAIGDVAGKGVSAALLMARLHASARYHLISSPKPSTAMTGLNAEISSSGLGFRLITLVFAVLDPKSKTVCIANAGHLPPVHRDARGKVQLIGMRESGLPLGVLPDQQFNEMTLSLKPGETLLFYTDGITEAMNAREQMFGKERLQKAVRSSSASVDGMVSSLIESVADFCGPSPQRDDICVTAVRCLS